MLEKITKVSVTPRQCVWAIFILFLASAAYAQNGLTITVNCDNGQTLSRTLSQLNKQMPTTVIVQGTCTEFVTIDGFEGLALKGQSGAAIQQPATNPHSNPYVLSITGSRGITISNLAVHSLPSIFSGIGIGRAAAKSSFKACRLTVPGELQFTRKAKFGWWE